MNTTKLGILILIILFIGFGIYYIFIDTLSFSELAGKQQNPTATIFLNLLDFDTGLTRYDVLNLKKKAEVWQAKERQIFSIQNPEIRRIEHEKLMAEMMQDPSFKKLSRKFLGMGAKGMQSILSGILAFSPF